MNSSYINYKIKKKRRKYFIKKKYPLEFIKKPIIIFIFCLLYSIFSIKSNHQKNIIPNLNLLSNKESIGENAKSMESISTHSNLLLPKYIKHQYDKNDKSALFKIEDSYDYKKMKETGKDKYIYDICTVTKAKHENLYVREFVEYYLSIGVDKFYFGDDDEENVENLSDVLDDYVKKGLVDINYIYYRNFSHWDFFEEAYKSLKFRCKWMLFIDVDEFLEFNDKNMNIKTYLNMPIFDKCDAIKIHWLMYDDNNLLYYDKRPLMQRLNHSASHHHYNNYHKSIVRGKDFKGVMFAGTNHQPLSETVPDQCDAEGNFERLGKGILGYPKYKYCHFRHSFKTAEEFAIKLLKGMHQGSKYGLEKMVDEFFRLNTFTEEKLKVFEIIFKTTFPKYHKNNTN